MTNLMKDYMDYDEWFEIIRQQVMRETNVDIAGSKEKFHREYENNSPVNKVVDHIVECLVECIKCL